MKSTELIPPKSNFVYSERIKIDTYFSKLLCFLIAVDVLLGLAHLILPEYSWGQGRNSYFNFENQLTFASWFNSIQLLLSAILFYVAFRKSKQSSSLLIIKILWLAGSVLLSIISFSEVTHINSRLDLFGLSNPDIYDIIFILFIQFSLLVVFGLQVLIALRKRPSYNKYVRYWLIAWGVAIIATYIDKILPGQAGKIDTLISFVAGTSYLSGTTFLLASLSAYSFLPEEVSETNPTIFEICKVSLFPDEITSFWRYLGIGGMTFIVIFIQLLLFRTLNIYADYLTANSIISIALVGISIGGLIGWQTAKTFPMQSIISASLILPFAIILSLSIVVKFTSIPFIAASFLMLPFIATSNVITVMLIRTKAHLVYAVDLIAAAAGALVLISALNLFREEGSILILSSLSFLFAGCFIYYLPLSSIRRNLFVFAGSGMIILLVLGIFNEDNNWLNIVRTKVEQRYPEIEFLHSRSSFIGRYDVVHTYPAASTFKTLENGRTIDNIRDNPVDEYKIDPRIPYTYMKNPKVLIIGLSGDGITKTAKAVSNDVTGIEINPAIADLQKNELAELNGNSYENIDVYVMDGKSFVAQSKDKFDMITLMNAHSVRGSIKGKSAGLEYLHTVEAFEDYIDHLNDKGLVNIEEPVQSPEQEPAVWKLIATMKQALINKGYKNPAGHFFVFQWRTQKNNYIQILMKKTPLDQKDIENFEIWLDEVDRIKELEKTAGQRLGPIRAITTILYSPGEDYQTNYAKILNGKIGKDFLESKNLVVTTDDRPFLFSVDPNYGEVKLTYLNTFVISLFIFPFLLSFLFKQRKNLRNSLPFSLIVMLTGMGYLLVEVVLIQRFQLFLGSPIESFAVVLCSLLIFSGLGSLWSGKISVKKLYASILIVLVMLVLHQWIIPNFLNENITFSALIKILITIATIAPLGFFMGVIFPFILRRSKSVITESAAGMFFAINAAASALAAPLAISISTSFGFKTTLGAAMLIYFSLLILILSLQNRWLQNIVAGLVTVIFISFLVFPFTTGKANIATKEGNYELYGISYGESQFPNDKIFRDGSEDKVVDFEWIFWLAMGNGRTILIDTGFDNEDLVQKWMINNYKKPEELIHQFGISPEEITDVILTHAHWDHIDCLASYKKAAIWIQKDEFEFIKNLFLEDQSARKGMRFEDYKKLQEAESEGRLKIISGEQEIYKGITLTLGGKHTHGSQYVTIETIDGSVIVAGDNAYMYENIRKHRPIGSAVEYDANLLTLREMHRKAASPYFILPGHDPKIFKWFPKVAENIVQITTIESY